MLSVCISSPLPKGLCRRCCESIMIFLIPTDGWDGPHLLVIFYWEMGWLPLGVIYKVNVVNCVINGLWRCKQCCYWVIWSVIAVPFTCCYQWCHYFGFSSHSVANELCFLVMCYCLTVNGGFSPSKLGYKIWRISPFLFLRSRIPWTQLVSLRSAVSSPADPAKHILLHLTWKQGVWWLNFNDFSEK